MKQIILISGLPASGKSTVVKEYVDAGFICISRDVIGGSLSNVTEQLRQIINKSSPNNIILDNTYITVESRKEPIEIGLQNGYEVKCIQMMTSFEDAQFNAVSRMIKKYGKLLSVDEMKITKDPNMFPVAAMYKAKKIYEAPKKEEGFVDVIKYQFKRQSNGYTNKAIIFDYDGTLRKTKSGNNFPMTIDDIEILPGRIGMLKKLKEQGYILLGASNQSNIAKGLMTLDKSIECFKHTNKLLGVDIDFEFCPHSVPPIVCYCRKPGPGIGVVFIEKYKLNPSQTIMVGDMTSDETFANRCGFKFCNANTFFNDSIK